MDGNPVALDRHHSVYWTPPETIERTQGFQGREEEATVDIKRFSYTYPGHNSDAASCELFPHFIINHMLSGNNPIKSSLCLVYALIR